MGLISGAVLTTIVGVSGLLPTQSLNYNSSFFPTMENCIEHVKHETALFNTTDYFKNTDNVDEPNLVIRTFEHNSVFEKAIIVMTCRKQE